MEDEHIPSPANFHFLLEAYQTAIVSILINIFGEIQRQTSIRHTSPAPK